MILRSAVKMSLGLAVSLISILLPLQIGTTPPVSGSGIGPEARPAQAVGGRYAVVIVIDAARADEVTLSQLPHLAQLAHAGSVYSDAWVGQLPSITEASHATIGTGVFPSRHNIYGEIWRVPGTETMSPDLLDGTVTRTGYIGKAIARTGVPSLAGIVKQHDPGAIVATMSGHKIYAADAMGAGQADFVAFGIKDGLSRYVPSAVPGKAPVQEVLGTPSLVLPSYPRQPGEEDAWVGRLAERFLAVYRPRVMMLNLPEVDTFGHMDGTKGTVMQPLMKSVDATIGRLMNAYRRAGLFNQTDWIVTADHGMVPATNTVQSTTVIPIVQKAGGQILYLGHGDYCTLWLKNPGSITRVAKALAAARLPHVSAVYARSSNGQYRPVTTAATLADPQVQQAYQDLLQTQNVTEAPDIILFFDENTITMTPSLFKAGREGDHGGATWGAQHIPLILEGPGIRTGYTSTYPARLVDIAPTVETLLGATPQNQDGVPLADSMTGASMVDIRAQQGIETRLSEDVSALSRNAALQSK